MDLSTPRWYVKFIFICTISVLQKGEIYWNIHYICWTSDVFQNPAWNRGDPVQPKLCTDSVKNPSQNERNNNSHHMNVYCIAPRCTFVQWTYSIIKMELFRVHPNFQLWNGLTNVALEWYSFSSNYSMSIISFCYCDSTLKFSTADSIYILQGILSDTWDSEKTQP